MRIQENPAGWGGARRAPRGSLEEFDALPLPVKRLFWFAPYDYAVSTATDAVRRLGPLGAVRRGLDRIDADVRRESVRLYGEAQIGWSA